MKGLMLGTIVYFIFDEQAAREVNRRRDDCRRDDARTIDGAATIIARSGAQFHVGTRVRVGDICPAMVTALFREKEDGVCNLRVMLDGNDVYWATEVEYDGTTYRPRSWHWMLDGPVTWQRPTPLQSLRCLP